MPSDLLRTETEDTIYVIPGPNKVVANVASLDSCKVACAVDRTLDCEFGIYSSEDRECLLWTYDFEIEALNETGIFDVENDYGNHSHLFYRNGEYFFQSLTQGMAGSSERESR